MHTSTGTGCAFALVSSSRCLAKSEFMIDLEFDGVRVFEFTNTGTLPLVITDVTSSCGCTIPEKPEDPILPGKTGEIKVKYDTNRVGPIRKTITVYSNADVPAKSIKIKGEVLPEETK